MYKHVLTVLGAEAGVTLAGLLGARLELSPELALRWVTGGGVYLDGRRCRDPQTALEPGQRVLAHAPEVAAEPAPEPELAFCDRWLAVLVKPAGMPSTPTRRGGLPRSLAEFALERLGHRARLMHRLDREASGLLLVSLRGGKSRRALSQQVSGHRVQRLYLALVQGIVAEPRLVLDGALSRSRGRTRVSTDPRARPAETHVSLLGQGQDRSLLQAELRTGHTHQIRAHLAHAGLPLLGDARYGGPPAPRLALHAHCLRLRHPRGGTLELHSPLPDDLRQLL
jgi:23S rRNA pseudouridine1911/1915/1917 synthase